MFLLTEAMFPALVVRATCEMLMEFITHVHSPIFKKVTKALQLLCAGNIGQKLTGSLQQDSLHCWLVLQNDIRFDKVSPGNLRLYSSCLYLQTYPDVFAFKSPTLTHAHLCVLCYSFHSPLFPYPCYFLYISIFLFHLLHMCSF